MLKLAVLFAVLYLAYELASRFRTRKPLPPGPVPLPLIGNLHQHRNIEQPWVKYQEWHKQFGDIITVKVGLRTVIVLGSQQAVTDILVKKGKTYCSPPKLVLVGDCMTRNALPVLIPISQKRRDVHRLVRAMLSAQACKGYAPLQERESLRLILGLAEGSDNDKNITSYSFGVATTLIYGERMGTGRGGSVDEARDIQALFANIMSTVSASNIIVELFPLLNLLPESINPWKKAGNEFRQHFTKLWARRIKRGLSSPNWNWARLVFDNRPQGMSEEEVLFIVAELEIGVSISTAMLIKIFVATALMNPAATQRVRAQVDEVIGPDRIPLLSDQDSLPLLRGFIWEMMRWKSAFSLSLPYAGLEEGEYKGYRIPADALIIVNQWALNIDPTTYRNPEQFRPERWVENPDMPTPPVFGYGRRVCPGEQLGMNSMFIAFARLLWAFDFKSKGDKLPVDENVQTTLGILSTFDPNGVTFVARDEHRSSVLKETFQTSVKDDGEILANAGGAVRLHLSETQS
ncbi:cytochrome P450 [Aspergillus karnatakaensis]|uniref:cytochrome P450 n=1 Tax=Aspergillus karnatakaensis TaxID=1810916 RepID=UPI003CCDC71A